jgi:hypothetical protein
MIQVATVTASMNIISTDEIEIISVSVIFELLEIYLTGGGNDIYIS